MVQKHLIRLGTVALVAAVAMGLMACSVKQKAPQGGLTPVTLMLNWTPNTHHAGIYAAFQNGWYAEEGIDLKIVEPAAAGADQVVASGGADFGISQAESVLPARAAGAPVVSIATLLTHNDSSFFALTSTGIKRPKDFEGKTYGGYGGPLERELLSTLVKCDGGDPTKVKAVEVGNIDYLPGMEQKRFDFVWVFEGWDVLRAREVERKDVTSVKFGDYGQCVPDWYTPAVIASEKTLKERPDLVRKFLKATARGYDLAIANPDQAAALLLKSAPELDKTLVAASARYTAPKYADRGTAWGTQQGKVWTDFAAFLRKSGLLEKDVPANTAFTNDFLPEAIVRGHRVSSMPDGRAIEVRGLSLTYAGHPPVVALDGVDLAVAPGEFAALLGPSGCGKSTLLRALAGLVRPTAGEALASSVAYMPQRDLLLPWRRVLGNATFAAELAGVSPAKARGRARALLGRFGLAGFERAWPAQLSGGMRQRLALLRTFLAPRDTLLLDEPFGALDAITRREMQGWLQGVLAEEPRTALLVTHDIEEALTLADTVYVMSPRPGRIVDRVEVSLTRPRDATTLTSPEFTALKAHLLRALAGPSPE